jgi:hypothetical protein
MSEPTGRFKWLSIVWAVLIGFGIIALAGSILMPSTKRARVDWDEVRRLASEEEAAAAAAAAAATTPTTAPTTTPADSANSADSAEPATQP